MIKIQSKPIRKDRQSNLRLGFTEEKKEISELPTFECELCNVDKKPWEIYNLYIPSCNHHYCR